MYDSLAEVKSDNFCQQTWDTHISSSKNVNVGKLPCSVPLRPNDRVIKSFIVTLKNDAKASTLPEWSLTQRLNICGSQEMCG